MRKANADAVGIGQDARLPENAFRKLAPGETYEPVIPAGA
jgi:hypothetical protein